MSSLLAIHPLPDDFTSPCTYPSEVKHPPQTHTTPHHPFPTLYLEAPHSSIPPVPLKSQLRPIYRSASADSSMRAGDKGKNVLAQARSYKISRPMALKSWRRAPPVQNFDERSVIGRKRSIASLLTTATHNNPPNVAMSAIPGPSCTSSSTSLLPATMGPDSAEDVKEPSAPFDWEVDLDPKDTFIEKDNWRMRSNTKVHPYALEEAPYMQSYGSTPLRSDYYTDILLQRLVPSGSPTFHDYGKRPPASVLDLGCGPGHWMLYASGMWKGSIITGLDLVDVTLPEVATTENIHFRRGNFVEYSLPFPEKSFELVRMANLALCIPYNKWPRLLVEVWRVLTPSGRLELIDDQIFFPYGSPPTKGQSRDNLHLDTPVDFDLEAGGFDEADDTSDNDEWADANSTFMSDRDSDHSSFNDAQVISPAATLTPNNLTETFLPTPVQPDESELSIWELRAARSHHLETIFERMLGENYGMHPRPSEFVLDLLEDMFGVGCTKKMNSYHLKIAPFDPSVNEEVVDIKDGMGPSLVSNFGLSRAKQIWKARDLNKGDRKRGRKRQKAVRLANGAISIPDEAVPDPSVITPKLAELLGIAYPGVQIPDIPPPSTLNAKAAARLGIPYPAIPISRNTSSDSGSSGDRSSLEAPPLPPKDARYLGTSPVLIAPCSSSTDTSSSRSGGSSSECSSLDTPATQSPVLSAKAAGCLGVSYSDLAAVASDSSPIPPLPIRNTFQPSGLLLWPKTYIPLSPDELEMHCSKHMQLLLGCRHGLIEFMTAHCDEHGERIASDDEIFDCLWDYECFRRTRFNWPLGSLHHSPENEWESDLFVHPTSSSPLGVPNQTSNHSRNLSDPSIQAIHSMDLNHVRSIHVFEARKYDGILESTA